MNMILKGVGYDAAEDFNRQVHDEIRKQSFVKPSSLTLNASDKD